MIQTKSQTKEVSDTVDSLATKVYFILGVDTEGSVHCHYPALDVIKVVPADEDYEVGDVLEADPEQVESLDGRPLAAWCEYVAHKRGWKFTTHRAPEGF